MEGPREMLSDSFFDIVITFSSPSGEETQAVDRDRFRYDLFVYEEVIPFFLVAWQTNGKLAMSFEVSLTVDKVLEEHRYRWLENERGNTAGMFLVNQEGNITEAIRFLE